MKNFNGVIESAESIRDYEYGAYSGAGEISDVFPNRFQLEPLTIKDQGAWSACVGCATATVLEAHYGEEFSEGWNYGRLRSETSNGEGMIHERAIEYLKTIGGLPKKKFDLLLEMPEIKKACLQFPELDEEAKKYRISGYLKLTSNVSGGKDLQIKKALTDSKKPLFAISTNGFPGGSHAIVLIGWDDEKDTYIFQNSWGKDYGKNGVGEIDKSKIDSVYQFLFEPIKLPFDDVNESDWFYDDVRQCYMSGLIKGLTENTFNPNGNITRAEACAMFNRLMKKVDDSLNTLNKLVEIKHKYNQLDGKESE